MALKPFNSIGGFAVGEGQSTIIDANLNITSANISANGNITASNISLTGNVDAEHVNTTQLNVTDFAASGNITVAGTSNVVGEAVFGSNVSVSGTLGALGLLGTASDLQVLGNASIGGTSSFTGDAGFAGNINVTGTVDTNSNLSAGGNLSVSGRANVTGNVYAGAFLSNTYLWANGDPFIVDAYGNANVQAYLSSGLATNAIFTTTVSAGGNISTGDNLNVTSGVYAQSGVFSSNVQAAGATVTNDISVGGTLTANTAISSVGTIYSNGNISTASGITATGDVTAQTFSALGTIVSAGNISGSNLNASGDISAFGGVTASTVSTNSLSASGNVTASYLNATNDISAVGTVFAQSVAASGQVSAAGNVTALNLLTSGTIDAASMTIVNGGSIGTDLLVGGWANITGVMVSQSVLTGPISATGNITGDNGLYLAGSANIGSSLDVGGFTTVVDLAASGNVAVTGNISGNNASLSTVTTSGFANVGGDLVVSGEANIIGNITANGVGTFNSLYVGTDGVIIGNLTITGNLVYTQIENAFSQIPQFYLGTGANGAPLTSDDGLDRAIVFDYYSGQNLNSALIWQHSSNTFQLASNVAFSNGIGAITSLGNISVDTLFGNVQATTISASGNITTAANIVAAGNISAANLDISGSFNAGSITSNNVSTPGNISAGGNIVFGASSSIVGGVALIDAVTTQQVTLQGPSGGSETQTIERFITNSNVTANIVSVNVAYGAAYDFMVKALDNGDGNVYRFLVSADSHGDYTITNNIGLSLGAAELTLNAGVLYLSVTPANGNTIFWDTKITTLL